MTAKEFTEEIKHAIWCSERFSYQLDSGKILIAIKAVLRKLHVRIEDIEYIDHQIPYILSGSRGYPIPWMDYMLIVVEFESLSKSNETLDDKSILFKVNKESTIEYVLECYEFN